MLGWHRRSKVALAHVATLLLCMGATAAVGRHVPIGPSATAPLPLAPVAIDPYAAGASCDQWLKVVSPRLLGSIGGLGHPSVCRPAPGQTSGAEPPLSVASVSIRPAPPSSPKAAPKTVADGFTVVRARVAKSGELVLLDDAAPGADNRVLRIIARELAYPEGLREGAIVQAVYETRQAKTHLAALKLGEGFAARQAFYYRDGASEGFYGRDGRSLEHRLLRYPVSYERISSPFSEGRRHPILKRSRPHYGVDFAAKPGTPVLAVGAGKVSEAGWVAGGNGRMVRVEHSDGYESSYAHLQAIAEGIKAGMTVSKGQVIGYVGSTGMATGPHLHFGLVRDGRHIDPLAPSLPKRASLASAALGAFRRSVARADEAIVVAAEARRQATFVASAKRP